MRSNSKHLLIKKGEEFPPPLETKKHQTLEW